MRRAILHLAILLAAVLHLPGDLGAQCARVGWVASVTPGCSTKIIDLDNGEIFYAFSGAEGLVYDQTITFSTALSPIPPGCSVQNGQAVSLTCVSDVLPCQAHYNYFKDNINPFQFSFTAKVYDKQNQQCHWDFGDGSSATGDAVTHGFPQQGTYKVCLVVSDNHGCAAEYCEEVVVSAESTNWCGYDMKVTAVGTQLIGKLYPLDDQQPEVLQSVYWYSNKSSNVLGQSAELSAPLPGYGKYLVCAQYNVANPDGSFTCTSTRCQELNVAEPGCVNQVMADASVLCPGASSLYAPVCGCNGTTYGNECEAITAGLSTWWAGDCASNSNACHAQMQVDIVHGSLDGGYIARFVNHSSDDYTFAQLDYGDGSPIWEGTQWDTLMHPYPAGGIYRTNLTTWKAGGCVSSVIQLLVTDALSMDPSSLPEGTDYVRPGDANHDGVANAYDLLHIGLGNSSTGSPRPEATTEWTPQFAPNWLESVADDQLNYKHLDCDGNGVVNEYDVDVIGQHYSAIDSLPVDATANAPQLRVVFAEDTIVVDAGNPAPVEIKGKVLLGSPSQPALGVYGLSFAMQYPEFVGHNPVADYKSDLFGSPNHMLWLSRDNHDRRQLDLALTRKNGQMANGYGAVADVNFRADFIIIIDIADRAANRAIPFTVPVRGVRAIDNQGYEKKVGTPVQLDTVWIKLVGAATGTHDALAQRITVSPNPAHEFTTLHFADLNAESVEVLDGLGRVLSEAEPAGQSMRLNVKNLDRGIYLLRIRSDKGLIMKRLAVE